MAYPPIVTYDERQQTLTTNLGNICSTVSCVTTCTSPESIQLILSTTSAHAFNFIVPGLSGGNHTVTFKIAVATDATATSLLAGAEAQAAVGVGSLTAQDGAGMRRVMAQSAIDLVILDLVLPGEDVASCSLHPFPKSATMRRSEPAKAAVSGTR